MASNTFFPNYTHKSIPISSDVTISLKISTNTNSLPPLLLLHGFPQTHLEFHKIAPSLEKHFTLILPDLRGYGASTIPQNSTNGAGMSKRLMASDCLTIMKTLGYDKFNVLGHDRGARVAYRLAFDAPQSIDKLILLDIIPTAANFAGFGDISAGMRAYHWLFLSQPAPFPETMIAGVDGGRFFLRHTLASWTGKRSLEDFDEAALEEYEKAYCSPERIHSTCEDYRAGAYLDAQHDEEELAKGRKIDVPTLVLWGERWLVSGGAGSGAVAEPDQTQQEEKQKPTPLDVWKKYASNVVGKGLPSGHFIPEEDPADLVKEVMHFFAITS